ncbi:MAG: hypothetical protein HY577_00595 [Candidatus Nealsonbacteria bacterium]|nr:hypothetical protein [Candidatus Nealsonbacteria bacterium]
MYIHYLDGREDVARVEIPPNQRDISLTDFGLSQLESVWLTTLCWSDGSLEAMTKVGGPFVIRRRFKFFVTKMRPDGIYSLRGGDVLEVSAAGQQVYRFRVEG